MACKTKASNHLRQHAPLFLNLCLRNIFYPSLCFCLFKIYLMITDYYWGFKRLDYIQTKLSCMGILPRVEPHKISLQLAIFGENSNNKIKRGEEWNRKEFAISRWWTYLGFQSIPALFLQSPGYSVFSSYFQVLALINFWFFCPFFWKKL